MQQIRSGNRFFRDALENEVLPLLTITYQEISQMSCRLFTIATALAAALIFLMLLAVDGTTASTKNSTTLKTVAVLEFQSDDQTLSKMLSEWTVSVLMDRKDLKVLERILLAKVLEEQKLSLTGAMNPQTTASIGKLVGASHLLVGSIGRVGSKYLVTTKIVAVETAEVGEAKRGSCADVDEIPDLLASLLTDRAITQTQVQNTGRLAMPLKGVWDGYFQYDDQRRGYATGDFSVTLQEAGGVGFVGEIIEKRKDFGPKTDTLHSVVQNGVFDPSSRQLSFIKVYDYDGHIVEYSGTLVSDRVIAGRWNIRGYTGSWRAVRRT